MLNYEPIDLSRFAVDLRDRHLEFWTPFSDGHTPRERNSKTLTCHQWCALPAQRALVVTHPPYRLPRYMLLDLPRDAIRSVARFRRCVHTLRFETATWNFTSSPTCDFKLCEADDDVQDEGHVPFHCTHPQMVSFRRKYTFYFSRQDPRMCLLFYTRKTTISFNLLVTSWRPLTNSMRVYASEKNTPHTMFFGVGEPT